MLILDAVYKVDIALVEKIKKNIENIFHTKVYFLIIQFNNDEDMFFSNDWLTIVGTQRGRCRDDYIRTPREGTIIRQLRLLPRRTWKERLRFRLFALWHTLCRAALVPPQHDQPAGH